jgi:bacillolysin
MKRILIAVLALSTLLVSAAPAAAASQRAAALRRDLGPAVRVAQHRETGAVRFVGAAAGKPIPRPSGVSASAPPAEAARAFLSRHGDAFGLRDQARELRVEASRGGARSSVRFQQVDGGVPVIAGELVADLDAQRNVLSVSGETLPDPQVDTSPQLGSAAARDAAIAMVAKGKGVSGARLDAGLPELGIYDARLLGGPGPSEPALVWQIDVKGTGGLMLDQLVFVDAHTGSVVLHIDQIENALDRNVCDANDTDGFADNAFPCDDGATHVATEADPPNVGDTDADIHNAFEFAGDTYNFYKSRFNRDSLDGAGLPLNSTVDYCDPSLPPSECPLENAFWNGEQMAYGNGFASADDVVGHELTHGVTEFSSHLFYWFQSGAINESLSDTFGEFVDQTNGEGDDSAGAKWKVGEDLSIGAIRDMQDPAAFDQPDRMTSANYTIDQGEGDNGGVHTNSGVNNKAAYLITDGETFNGHTITGIGLTKAARIYYEVETAFLTSGSDYADLGSALGQACANLVGTVGITAGDCTQVRSAVAATEMGTNPPNASAPEAPAASCGVNQVLQTRFFDDMESDASGDNWTTDDTNVWNYDLSYAHSGDFDLSAKDLSSPGIRSLELARNIALPADATSSFLRFDHAYGFDDFSTTSFFDGGVVEYSTDGGGSWSDISGLPVDVGYNGNINSPSNPLDGHAAFVSESNGYRATRATLTSLAGKSVRFRFRIATNSGNGSPAPRGWFIDDVRIYSCLPDTDGDGVANSLDACPTVAGTQGGCPPPPVPGGGAPGGGGTTGGGGGTTSTTTLASAKVRSCKISGKGKKLRVKCSLRGFGAVKRAKLKITLKGKKVLSKTVKPSKGVLSLKPARKLKRGAYKISITLIDARGKTRKLSAKLKVK